MIENIEIFNNQNDQAAVDEINDRVIELNKLINLYNSAKHQNKAEMLLQVHQQLQKVDATIGGMGVIAEIAEESLLYTEFYKKLSTEIGVELKRLGCEGLSAEQINQWDIENCKNTSVLPSSVLFEKETKPGFMGSIFGTQRSTPINKAIRLLKDIKPASIKENSQENYYQLTNLKHAIRDLFATETISSSDQKVLRDLVAKINGRLSNIVENNTQLRSKVYPPVITNLAQQLSNLNYEQAQEMTNMLIDPKVFNSQIFKDTFNALLPDLIGYDIEFLGGANAKNYLITNIETQEKQVLKITPKGNSRKTYERLKSTSVKEGITDVYASKESLQANNNYMYSLELTEFCPNSDLLSHGIRVQNKIDLITKELSKEHLSSEKLSLQKLYIEFGVADQDVISDLDKQGILTQLKKAQLLNATSMYSQMSNILLNFQANNAFFPDMKPTNFLVNEFDQVVIADTKSFIESENGMINEHDIYLNKAQFVLKTPGMLSPQFENDGVFSVDKEHSYLMGLSLYCYITGTSLSDLPKKTQDHPAFINFDKEVFQSEQGQQFRELITGLTQVDPEQRFSMQQAKDSLHNIALGQKAEINHDISSQESPFRSKSEAHFFALHNLLKIAETTDNSAVNQAISDIKILIENHEQDPSVAANILQKVSTKLEDGSQQKSLNSIAKAIINSDYQQQSPQEKYENPLARRFESEMQIAMLKSPTSKMMSSVGHVSKALLNVFEQIEKSEYPDILDEFAANLTSGREQTGFGSQPDSITKEQMKDILQRNEPQDLNQILYIQFLFAQKQMRALPISIQPPNQNLPRGKLLELVKEYNNGEYRDNPQAFFDKFDKGDMIKLGFISDNKMYGSDLFTADPTRGREGRLPAHTFSNQMGIMLDGQNQDGLDKDRSHWTPDSKYQGANVDSPFTRDLIENDAVYCAGPSGMTSLFMGMMENYGNFDSVEAKQNYFSAVSAYMVSGGLHSMHEVLGPAQYALDLIPGYNVTAPEADNLAAPPNFHQFYQQQMDIDPEFASTYDKGWDNVMAAYATQAEQFVHAPIVEVSHTQQAVIDAGTIHDTTNKYTNMTDDELRNAMTENHTLETLAPNEELTSSKVSRNRSSKEFSIQKSIFKINICALQADDPKLQQEIKKLYKTVCKTRTNIFKSYSTSTTSADKLTEKICESKKLREVFGINGDNEKDWKKEIKARMENAYKDKDIPEPDFSVRPGI